MTSFNESEINRAADGKFAPKSTSETSLGTLVSQRRSALAARKVFTSWVDDDMVPHRSIESYVDRHDAHDDAETATTRGRSWALGYLAAPKIGMTSHLETDAYDEGRSSAVADRFVSPAEIESVDHFKPGALDDAQTAHDEHYASVHGETFDPHAAEEDPGVIDARARLDHRLDTLDEIDAVTFGSEDTRSPQVNQRIESALEDADEAYVRYESRRLTRALNA